MARVRSPNYPLISLPEAIGKVTAFYQAEQHLAAPKEVVAKHIGYASYHSLAARMISAIEKYGLLEETGGDKVKVSTLAMSILYPKTPEEKQKAINEAAFTPTLFAAIRDEWQGSMPSEQNLRVYLVRRKFASDALDKVIQIYRETMSLVTQEAEAYHAKDDHQGQPEREVAAMQPSTFTQPPQTGRGATPSPAIGNAGMSVSFTGDRLQVSAILEDGEAVDKLIKALSATKALLPEKPADPEKSN
jgi:hypothetical protein